MAFTGRTPESLLPRADSRNPATTCKGITKSGRPCRRPIDAKMSHDEGVIAVASVLSDGDEEEMGAAAYFCWQHKDQAEQLAARDGEGTRLYPLKERNSIDTLVARLGVLEVDGNVDSTPSRKKERRQERRTSGAGPRPPRRIQRPRTWEHIEGPLMSVPSDMMAREKQRRSRPPRPLPHEKKRFWAWLCCGQADEERVETVRHGKRRTSQSISAAPVMRMTRKADMIPSLSKGSQIPTARPSTEGPRRPSATTSPITTPARKPISSSPAPPTAKRRESETTTLLRFIPSALSPQLTSTLLTELSKPVSQHDEAGYIYMFWLTPEASGPAPSTTASTLLAPVSGPDQARRTSDMMRQHSVPRPPTRRVSSQTRTTQDSTPATMLIKIGRANNVHRRMHEWHRQCGYSLSLVRFYPYTPTASSPAPALSPSRSHRVSSGAVSAQRASVRKVPYAHRVERLVHLELGAQRVVRSCEACGKMHREWFEVEASREGIARVDEVVRRWVEWAERYDAMQGEG